MPNININNKTIAFISDWEKRAASQQRKYTIWSIVAFISTIILCIFLFFVFQNGNYDRIVKQNMNYIQDSAIQEANQIEQTMENVKTAIIDFAKQYSILDSFDTEMTINEKLTSLQNKSLFDRLAYIDPDGMDTSLEGSTYVGDRQYFQKAMSGESGWELLQKSRITGEPTVVFYAPIMVHDEITGVMAGFYGKNRLDDLFSYQLFNYKPRTYLLLDDGTEVASSNDEDAQENLLIKLSRQKFIGNTDYDAIKKAIADESRTTITFSFIDNHDTSVGVIVQFNHSDWMLLSVLPHDVTSNMVGNANRMGMRLLIEIAAVFFLLLFILLFFLRKQKTNLELEMSIASDSLKTNIEKEQKQLAIIESLGDVYSSIYYINMNNLDYQRIKEDKNMTVNIPDTGNAAKSLSIYIENFIDDSDKEAAKKFFDTSTYRKRFKKNKTLVKEYQRKDVGWCRATLAPAGLDKNGRIDFVILAVQQIDQEKQKELQTKKALQEAYNAASLASSAKTTFLSNMSHDIRTPMNAIVGMTAIAAANLDNTDKVSDCLKKITTSSRHLLGLINEVLDMSKIESGKVDLNEEEFSLSDLIDNLISIHQPLIKEKNHTLVVKINNLTHEEVIGDGTRLQQVFSNLLSNAIKYTPENGKIEITVSEKETNKSTIGWYEVIFKDNGIGMSEEFQHTIFEPFSRSTDERITNIQGTGLGMPIAKNIINMMNGDITLDSKIDSGTTFTVSFALKLKTEQKVDYEKFTDLSILVVDDDITACESTCSMLNSLTMNSEWVTSGREAVEKTETHHKNGEDYYAVIIDWKMPDMNGIETTKEIRRRIGSEIPIIVISAYDWSEIEQEAKEAGVNDFLSKPLFKSRLVDLFSELTGNARKENNKDLKQEINQYDFSGKKVLLAEDNEINRELAVELLSMAELETETAENGKICLEKFTNAEPGYYDIILMDIQMPVMNGYETAKAIRASSHPDAKKIPIIALTANAFASDVRAAVKAGMNGHLAKPIDISHVLKVLSENIDQS